MEGLKIFKRKPKPLIARAPGYTKRGKNTKYIITKFGLEYFTTYLRELYKELFENENLDPVRYDKWVSVDYVLCAVNALGINNTFTSTDIDKILKSWNLTGWDKSRIAGLFNHYSALGRIKNETLFEKATQDPRYEKNNTWRLTQIAIQRFEEKLLETLWGELQNR